MNISQVREVVFELTSMFFQGATVIWAEQSNTMSTPPYVTLKTNGLNRTRNPVTTKDGKRYYPCSTKLEVNLYTKGEPITAGENMPINYANTAVSDLCDFFNFLDSEEMTDIAADKGICIVLEPPIRDLSELQNETRYRYRAMAEATILFAQEADGLYALSGMTAAPNNSGGATEEMRSAEMHEIKEVEMNEGGTDDNEK